MAVTLHVGTWRVQRWPTRPRGVSLMTRHEDSDRSVVQCFRTEWRHLPPFSSAVKLSCGESNCSGKAPGKEERVEQRGGEGVSRQLARATVLMLNMIKQHSHKRSLWRLQWLIKCQGSVINLKECHSVVWTTTYCSISLRCERRMVGVVWKLAAIVWKIHSDCWILAMIYDLIPFIKQIRLKKAQMCSAEWLSSSDV